MNSIRSTWVVALAGVLAMSASPARAQSTPPVPPPPTASDPAPSPRSIKGNDAPVESTNAAGQPASARSIHDLRFAAVDANADGRISLSEFTTFMDAGNMTRGSGSDDNRGGVNPTELLFRQIDRNGDNFLSEAEVTAYQDEQDRNGLKR